MTDYTQNDPISRSIFQLCPELSAIPHGLHESARFARLSQRRICLIKVICMMDALISAAELTHQQIHFSAN